MRGLLLLLSPFLFAPVSAQKQGRVLIDSLVAQLPKAANDTVKTRLYRAIAEEWFFINSNQAFYYSQLGLQHATRMKWQRGIGVFNTYLARAYSEKGNYNACRYHNLNAIAIYKTINDTWNLASTLNNLGVAEQNIHSDYPAAARYYFEGLKIAEATGDNYLIGISLDNLSGIYRIQQNYPKALQFGQQALALRQQQHNPGINAQRERAAALTSMAALYTQMKNFSKARQYGMMALAAHQRVDNKEGMAKTFGNLSLICQRNYGQKIYYALQAKQLWDRINPQHPDAVDNLGNLGIAYLDLVRYDTLNPTTVQPMERSARLQLAGQYLKKAIRRSADKGEISSQAQFRGNLAELQAMVGNYKGAYENFRSYQAVQDSLYSQESKNKIAGLAGKREIDLRDKQLEINRLAMDAQQRQQIGLLVGVGLLLMIGGLLYWQNRTRKRTNITLLHLNQELDEANQVKTRFFAILSHDLRSPIANLINFLHLQRESPDLIPADQVARHQQNITEAAEGLLDNMESMLLWSKGQMQQFKPDVKIIPVATLFAHLQRFFAGASHVRFSFSAPDGLQLATDEDYLRTIMQNLTSNAIHALTNRHDAYIHWQARPENDRTVLIISDNGSGLSESQLKVLYTNNAAIGGKSGLGLHLIRDLASAIACQISVRSEPGNGTEFRLDFGRTLTGQNNTATSTPIA